MKDLGKVIVGLVSTETFKVTERWSEENIFLLSRSISSPSWLASFSFNTLFAMFYLHVSSIQNLEWVTDFFFHQKIYAMNIGCSNYQIHCDQTPGIFTPLCCEKFIIIKNNLPTEYALTKYKYIFLTIILPKREIFL